MVAQSALTSMPLGACLVTDADTNADEDAIICEHPQFPGSGVYCLFRGHSRPGDAVANAIAAHALSGHPQPSPTPPTPPYLPLRRAVATVLGMPKAAKGTKAKPAVTKAGTPRPAKPARKA